MLVVSSQMAGNSTDTGDGFDGRGRVTGGNFLLNTFHK